MIHWIFLGVLAIAITFTVIESGRSIWDGDGIFLLMAISWAVVLVVGLVWGALAFESAACDRFSQETGLSTEFYAIGGCYVEADGHSIPVDEDSIALLVRELTK